MLYDAVIPVFDAIGTIGFLFAVGIGIRNYQRRTIERPFWLAFTLTAAMGSLWLALVTLEWLGVSSQLLDLFSTSLQAVIIGMFAVGVIGSYVIVEELKGARKETLQRSSIVSILSRVLRHNLRNDMTVIRGHTTEIAGEVDEAETILRRIDDLIGTSEKARKLEEIVASRPTHTTVNLDELVQRITREFDRTDPSVSISVHGSPTVSVSVMPSFEAALRELIENAVEHSGPEPTVTVEFRSNDGMAIIEIGDQGPGFSTEQRRVLDTDIETPLIHSEGIGLWIAQWILSDHGGHITATNTDSGAIVTVTVPLEREDAPGRIVSDLPAVHRGYDRYHAIFETDSDGFVVVDDDERIIDANDSAHSLLAISQSEMLGRPLDEVLPQNNDIDIAFDETHSNDPVQGTIELPSQHSDERLTVYTARSDFILGEHLLQIDDPNSV